MEDEKKYTVVVKGNRVEVSREVYYAYHQAREAERYKMRVISKKERSLEQFQEEGVSVEYQCSGHLATIENELIKTDEINQLYYALDKLKGEEYSLIKELFFFEKSERKLAAELGIAKTTLHTQKHRILKKIKKLMENEK